MNSDFVQDLKKLIEYDVTYYDNGFSTVQKFNESVKELLKRYPEFKIEDVRKISFALMKSDSKEIRKKWYEKFHHHENRNSWIIRLISKLRSYF